MKTTYEWYEKKNLTFSYFGNFINFTYEHVGPSENKIHLHTNKDLLNELGLSNPFTLFHTIGLLNLNMNHKYHYDEGKRKITKGRTLSGSTRVCGEATRLFTAEFKSDV